jgi:methyl-accepting chemotaxis protein
MTTSSSRLTGVKWSFLTRLRLWQKFGLLGVLAVALGAIPLTLLFQRALADNATVRAERAGLAPIEATLGLIKAMQSHRGSGSSFVLNDEKRGASQSKDANEVDAALSKLDVQIRAIAQPALSERVAMFKKSWVVLKENVTGRKIDQRRVTEDHITLIHDMLRMVEELTAYFKIDLDPNAAAHYTFRATLVELPQLSETLGQLRSPVVSRLEELASVQAGIKAGKIAKPEASLLEAFSAADRSRVAERVRDLEEVLDRYVGSMRKAISASPDASGALTGEVDEILSGTRQAIELVKKEILAKEIPTIDAAAYFAQVSAPREVVQKAATRQQLLEQQLDQRVVDARNQAAKAVGGELVLLLVSFFVAYLIVRNITGTVASLQRSVEMVRAGDFVALQDIASRDEVGDLGRTVNNLLQERMAAQKKAEEENEGLNNSVISILQAVNQLSQRDLTAKAPVTQDIIGTVSDSINLLTDETSKVLIGVNLIAGHVVQVSNKVRSQAELVSTSAEGERKDVALMIVSLADATESMNQVAALAEQSNRSAERATQATETALETVNGTVKGMESIRETISETEKRIKRLGERSQEITGIVNLINTISERTHVLALNASMQAAVAGEAGRGFAVVAEEVQRLAESSRNATQQIGTLVSNIQLETNETISTVNRTIGQVVHGSEQAQKAGEQMRLTQEITGELVAQVRRIAEASDHQKGMSLGLLQSVQRIGQSNERTSLQIDAQNQETETLLDSARRLVESVSVFKLPQSA